MIVIIVIFPKNQSKEMFSYLSAKTRNKGWEVKGVGNLPFIVVAREMESKHNNANSQYLPKLATR